MSRRLLVVAVAALSVVLPGASSAQEATTLLGEVGPGFTISLKNPDGSRVTHLDPGTYMIAVQDRSIEHNFHLFGEGVDQATEVDTLSTVTWTVTFVDGKIYRYQCDPHLTSLRGSFGVGNVPPPPPPPAKLSGKVGPGKTIALKTAAGARVKSLAAATYRLTVRDLTKVDNFHLVGPGVNRKTKVAGKGTATWTLALRAGKYSYRSDRTRSLRRTFTVR